MKKYILILVSMMRVAAGIHRRGAFGRITRTCIAIPDAKATGS